MQRREVLTGIAAAGLMAKFGLQARPAFAQPDFKGRQVVFVGWGGAYQDAQKASYCEPFAAKTGAEVLYDGPTDYSKLRIMVEGKQVIWDVVDVQDYFLGLGSADGLFEEIDTGIVNTSAVAPAYVDRYGVGCMVFSFNLGYGLAQYPGEERPRSWADFFDLQKFPGRRSIRDRADGTLEAALLADGVSPENLYPLDVDRAFRKLDTIKEQSLFWATNAQSQQHLVDGEAVMGIINNGRIYDSVSKGAKLGIEWNQNIRSGDYLVVPKGSPNKELAMHLINEMTVAENQAKLANMITFSPTNPDAFQFVDDNISHWLSTNLDNMKLGVDLSKEFWRDNLSALSERWAVWKLS